MKHLLVCSLALLVWVSPVFAENRPKVAYGAWAVFVDDTKRPRACWAATKLGEIAGRPLLFAATKFDRHGQPQLSVYSTERLPKSAGISLVVDGSKYRMRSNGTYAWLWPARDRVVIKAMYSGKAQDVEVVTKSGAFSVKLIGFAKAFSRVNQECN